MQLFKISSRVPGYHYIYTRNTNHVYTIYYGAFNYICCNPSSFDENKCKGDRICVNVHYHLCVDSCLVYLNHIVPREIYITTFDVSRISHLPSVLPSISHLNHTMSSSGLPLDVGNMN